MTGDEVASASYQTAAQQFGARLRNLRERAGLSLRDLERRTRQVARKHVTKSVIGRIEKGTTAPSVEVAQLLDTALEAGGTLEVLGVAAQVDPFPYLAAGPPYFVGRRAELARLNKLADDHLPTSEAPAVLVISGPPGVGKTALALRWANTGPAGFDVVLHSAQGGSSTGAQSTQSEFFEDLLRSLGVQRDCLPTATHQQASLLRDQLSRRKQRVLVVLDNIGDSYQVQPLLPHLAGTTVLMTSRSPLRGLELDCGAETLQLDMMDGADAVDLVIEVIGDDRAVGEPDAVAQLVALCASLPLAVITAAERIAAEPDTSIQHHVDALADIGRRLYLLNIDGADVRDVFR